MGWNKLFKRPILLWLVPQSTKYPDGGMQRHTLDQNRASNKGGLVWTQPAPGLVFPYL